MNAETGRVNAESARVKAESARANAEATRAANEEQRKKNESARTSTEAGRVEAEKGRVAAESARVTEFARLKNESETATKNATDAAAEAKEVSSGVAALERDLGQYAELPSVAMTAETTGKYINADGEFVDDADFNIAAIGAVVVGNTYELYMGGADKMKLGVALFVALIKTTTTSGIERIEYVPLFSAMSTDIPTSGYVCFEAMEAYSDVLVCYRADVPEAATLLVRRYGTKASIATQINNLRKKVDLKSFADGYYESMRVGTADNLTSKGDATEEIIMSRKAGGDNQIEDGSASIKRIKGYSVVKNQYSTVKDFKNKLTDTKDFLLLYIVHSNTVLWGKTINSPRLVSDIITIPNDTNDIRIKHKGNKVDIQIFQVSSEGFINHKILFFANIRGCNPSIIDGLNISDLLFIDLSQMFGSGNEPTTPDDFAKRLGYSSIDDVPYIPYNEGKIVSSFAEGIKTTDTEGKVSERKWSETLKKYFPDGLKSAGSAFDEITPTKAVKRIRTYTITGKEPWIMASDYRFVMPSIPGVTNILNDANTINRLSNYYTATTKRKIIDKSISSDSENNWAVVIRDIGFSSIVEFVTHLQSMYAGRTPVIIEYVVATIEETTYDELNLTEQVAEGGTEEAIITDGKTSTPLRADIVYPIDAYNTIKANKTHIGTLSSLNTASKTDLVSAINELAGKVGALEAKATESVNNETTE
ncbi:collagen triple helix repeat protein [Bacteroides sp. CAG:709]|nr:collagen triple helix repeat protein [Bacteroides sp. CAG:709]